MTIIIPDICNRVRVSWFALDEGTRPVALVMPLCNQAPLARPLLIEGVGLTELKTVLLTDEWTRTQPFPNHPQLANVVEFVRNDPIPPAGETG